jgi:ketosteroid isomerase-like protein
MTKKVRRSIPGAAVLLIAAFGGLASAAPDPTPQMGADEETRQAVTAVKQAILAGHKARDRAALDRLYADDYTAIDAKGEVTTKTQLLAGLATGPEIAEGRYEIIAVRRWGDTAVANGHGHIVYRNADGSTRVSDYDSVNVFALRAGRWYYVAAFLP